MKKILSVIKNAPIFDGITEGKLEAVLGCLDAKTTDYKKGSYILHAGDKAQSMALLLSGSVLIVQEDFWGNRNLMARIMPGQLFAESFACSPDTILNVSAVADEACTVMRLNAERILTTCTAACAHHSRIIRNLLSILAQKNRRLNEKLTYMGQRTTREKLMSYLSAQAMRCGASEFDIPLNRQQLADYLGVERSAMSAQLCKLRDSGVLTFERNHFSLNIL